MKAISTHVLDTSRGCAAVGMYVCLFFWQDGAWVQWLDAYTDDDGRVADWPEGKQLKEGRYRLAFDVKKYLEGEGLPVFYPRVDVEFLVADASQHYHVPLLMSPYGYSTYRGS